MIKTSIVEKYAIAIKDLGDLFMMFEICRKKDNIYVNGNEKKLGDREDNKHYHWTKHASGELHYKTHDSYVFPKPPLTQVPDSNFRGSEVIATTSIRQGDGRAWNVLCKKEDYSEVMIIEDQIIMPEFGYQLNVEIVGPKTEPWILTYPYARIIQQQTFSKKIPHIVVSLYEVNLSEKINE